ncbi:MAG: helix-turn-helix domain-containing protein [Aeromicrobium sp.]
MSQPVKRRTYDATGRRAQAELTRRRIVDEAGKLFVQTSYQRTTMEGIAAAAGVSVETVYALFRNKRTILARFLDVSVVGDHEAVPVLERAAIRAVAGTEDPHELIARLAAVSRVILERAAPAHRALRSAAEADQELAHLLLEDQARRYQGQTAFVRMIATRGPLRGGISVEEAADVYWSVASPEMYALLTVGRGWTPEKFQNWLGDALIRLLLPDGDENPTPG